MKLGQLLVKKRIIGEDQLRAVLVRQKGEGARLGEMLVRLGLVSKRDILSSLAAQPGFLLDSVALAQIAPSIAAIEPDFEACPHCGVDLRTACPGCGHDTKSDWRTCPYCRVDLESVIDMPRRQRLPATRETDEDDVVQPAIRALGPGLPG